VSERPVPGERSKHAATFLALATAVVIACVAALQNGANVTAGEASRDLQLLTMQLADDFERLGLQANFEMGVIGQSFKDVQEAQVLRLSALDLEARGSTADAAATRARADVMLARAQREKQFSSLFRDAQYAPNAADKLPEIRKYVNDLQVQRTRLVGRITAVNQRYIGASRVADTYTMYVTILAIALFLFGLAQALEWRARLVFIAFGVMALAAGTGGALILFLRWA